MTTIKPAANKRRPKGEVIAELQAQIVRGRELCDRLIADDAELASASVDKLAWRLEVLQLLPHMSKGIQAAADFNRAAFPAEIPGGNRLDEELGFFRLVMAEQLAGLEKAVDRWSKSNTRPLV